MCLRNAMIIVFVILLLAMGGGVVFYIRPSLFVDPHRFERDHLEKTRFLATLTDAIQRYIYVNERKVPKSPQEIETYLRENFADALAADEATNRIFRRAVIFQNVNDPQLKRYGDWFIGVLVPKHAGFSDYIEIGGGRQRGGPFDSGLYGTYTEAQARKMLGDALVDELYRKNAATTLPSTNHKTGT